MEIGLFQIGRNVLGDRVVLDRPHRYVETDLGHMCYPVLIFQLSLSTSQDKEPSARSELAVIQPLWPSVDLLIFRKSVLIRVLESQRY